MEEDLQGGRGENGSEAKENVSRWRRREERVIDSAGLGGYRKPWTKARVTGRMDGRCSVARQEGGRGSCWREDGLQINWN